MAQLKIKPMGRENMSFKARTRRWKSFLHSRFSVRHDAWNHLVANTQRLPQSECFKHTLLLFSGLVVPDSL